MLSNNLTMEINEDFSISAHHPLILVVSVQLPAVDASVQYRRALVLSIWGIY
jgi:hypothetical protein